MFVFRCAFWLTIGFLVVAPHGTDFGATASAMKDQAIAASVEAGEKLLVSQVLGTDTVVKTMASRLSATTPSAVLPMQDSSAAPLVFPRPRPAAMG